MVKVAIQGGRASFHEIAARNYFKDDVEMIECGSFPILCETLKKEEVDYAVMAIENSIAGSILPNYALLQKFDFLIIGEIYLRIEQNLMALPGTTIDKIEKARSHYMALLQCQDFLQKYPHIKLEEYHDTADSARDIRVNGEKNVAAIAGRYAAELYNLDILAESIETEKKNYTRFLILSRDKRYKTENKNKATISFHLPNRVGALADVLRVIVENNINLTKIQSLPIIGRPNEYTFYVDCEFFNYEDFKKSIEIKNIVENLRILGEYRKGETIHDYTKSRQA